MRTILYKEGNTDNVLYVYQFVEDSDMNQPFEVINGCWDGIYDAGTIFLERTKRTIGGYKCFHVNPDIFQCQDYSDYNEVICRFQEIIKDI